MTLEQPLDKRLFDSDYDDVEILGKLVTRGDHWRPIGFALHVQNGAVFGAAYARLKPALPGSAVLRGLLASLIEHVAASRSPRTTPNTAWLWLVPDRGGPPVSSSRSFAMSASCTSV